MSGTNSNSPPGPNGAGDPSMEDILASIRRILAEDEPVPDATSTAPADGGAAPPTAKEDVLVLDASMLAPAPSPEAEPLITPSPEAAAAVVASGATDIAAPAAAAMAVHTNGAVSASGDDRPLILRNTLPCFEDAVREALEPVIKQWLNAALPKLVERLVRTEVERVVGGVVQ